MDAYNHSKRPTLIGQKMSAILDLERKIKKDSANLERAASNPKVIVFQEINALSKELFSLFGDLQCDIYKMPLEQRDEHLKKSYNFANALLSKIERNTEAEQLLDLLNMNMTKEFKVLWDYLQKYCEGIELKYIWAQHKVA